MKTFKSIAHSAVVIVFTAFACHAQLPVQVKVEAGLIRGTAENDLTVFRGIPFAAPPIGSLRWKAPQPVSNWDGVKEAFHFAASPMQGGNRPAGKARTVYT